MTKGCLVAILIILAFIISGGAYIYRVFIYGELANKPFYVCLQGFAERREYNPPLTENKKVTPIFVKGGIVYNDKEYDLLGIPTKDKMFPYFWIVTNIPNRDISNSDHVFSINAGSKFYLSCDFLDKLEKKEEVIDVVKKYLRSRCMDD